MGTKKRMQLIRMLEKMQQNPEFSRKLGIRDKSDFKPEKERDKVTERRVS